MISIIAPTLNEEKSIANLLYSLELQSLRNFEVVIVDGGSADKTVEIAKRFLANTLVVPKCGEFSSRNIGARKAKGDILLFTSADVILPRNLLENLHNQFKKDDELVAISGSHTLLDAPIIGKLEYTTYNLLRYILAKLPKPIRGFSSSTNFLAVKRRCFEATQGFDASDVNADGIMGAELLKMGKVRFCLDAHVFISARRVKAMGFWKFHKHYLYVLENFLPIFSRTNFFRNLKQKTKREHIKLHI